MSGDEVEHARMWLEAGQPAETLRILSPALATRPDDVEVLAVAASAHLELNQALAALELATRAAWLAPNDEWVWRLVSTGHSALGQTDQAIAAAETAHRLAPNEWQTLANVALTEVNAGRATARSRHFADAAVTMAPNEPHAHLVLGNVAMQMKDVATAKLEFRAVLRLDPTNAIAANNLATFDQGASRVGYAAAGFIDIIAADPTASIAVHNVRVLVTRALLAFHRILWAVWAVANFASLPSVARAAGDENFLGPWLRWGLAVVAILGVIGYAARLRRQAGPRFRQFLATAARFETSLRTWAIALGAVVLSLIVAAILPWPLARLPYGLCFVALLLGMLASRRLKKLLLAERSSIPDLFPEKG